MCDLKIQGNHQRSAASTPIGAVLRVAQADRYVGDVLLNRQGKVWRSADSIPADVVLKAFVAFRRSGDECGQIISRADGLSYGWFLVGSLVEAA